jgi:hypothetical protein
MIRKSVQRFSEEIHAQLKSLKRDSSRFKRENRPVRLEQSGVE